MIHRSSLNKHYFISIAVSFGLFFLIMGFIFNAFYKSTRNYILTLGKKSMEESSLHCENYLAKYFDILDFTADTLVLMRQHHIENKNLLHFIKDTSIVFRKSIDEPICGLYGYIDGNYFDEKDSIFPDGYSFIEQPWYEEAVKQKNVIVATSPYHDAETGKLIVTFSKCFDEKDVIAIDFTLDPLIDFSKQVFDDSYNYCMIFDKDGFAISTSKTSNVGENFLSGTTNQSKIDFFNNLFSNQQSGNVFPTNINGIKGICFSKEIGINWYICYIVNTKYQFKTFFRNVFLCFALSLLPLGILLYFCFVTDKKSKSEDALSKQLIATSEIYMAMYVFDLQENTFRELKTIPFLRELYTSLDMKDASRSMNRIMNYVVDEQFQLQVNDFINLETLPDRIAGKKTITQEFIVKETGWCRGRFIVVDHDENFNLKTVLWVVENIDIEKQKENHLRYLSETDLMTGIRNRGSGERKITELISEGSLGLFCMFDVDKFKSINDTFGHETGDKVIIEVARAIEKSFRDNDIFFRLGGDEFAAFAIGVTEKRKASVIIKRLFDNISKISIPELIAEKHSVSISAGVSFFDGTEKLSFKDLYNRADECVYKSKKKKNNSVSYFKKESEK